MPEPRAVALVGDLLATQAKVGGRGRRCSSMPRCATRGAGADGPADLGALGAGARRRRRRRSARSTSRSSSAARRSTPATSSCWTPTASQSSRRARVERGAGGVARARGEASASSAGDCRQGSAPTISTGCARVVEGCVSDIAHLGPVELLTPDGRSAASRSSSTCSGWRSRARRAARCTCAAGATTSATAWS